MEKKNRGKLIMNLFRSPVLSTSGESRKKTGRAYEGRAFCTSRRNVSQLKSFVTSAMAAIPAFPSTPDEKHREQLQWQPKALLNTSVGGNALQVTRVT